MLNRIGHIFSLTSFGESHGAAIGGVIDGMPAGISIDIAAVQAQLARRKPGQSALTTSRREEDEVRILSGLFNGVTTGTPIGFMVENTAQRSSDYNNIACAYRPNHADYTYDAKYGIRDYRGGGRASARETIARVVAGAFASQALAEMGIEIAAFTSSVGEIDANVDTATVSISSVDATPVRCPDIKAAEEMSALILDAKKAGDSVGGTVTCVIRGLPAGIGEPVFGRLNAELAGAMMSIPAAKGFEVGAGFESSRHRGSELMDIFYTDAAGKVRTRSNNSGGIQGGISNGENVVVKVAFKPAPTLLIPDVPTIDNHGESCTVSVKGRHDPCVVPRAVPVVEAMAAIVCLDNILINRTRRI